ncbi:serine/Arginine-related protein 53-like [Acomys russatus]|uniref:serine/Arginine-related protein 53-like n=1 Tax=Acomys russatus TaxID=60746 RepID=UPI0021E33A6F|nr:serine/Arginine-related protein 53-like [Acomys russatus]
MSCGHVGSCAHETSPTGLPRRELNKHIARLARVDGERPYPKNYAALVLCSAESGRNSLSQGKHPKWESGNIKAGLEHLPPAEQAKARLQLVLEAAAKADEALKAKERNEEEAKRRKEEDQATLVEQVKRVKEIEAIESDSFVQQTFRSSKEVKKSVEPIEVKHMTPASGPASVAPDPPSVGKEIDPDSIPTAIKYQDDNSLAHPNLFIEKAEAEEKWFKRLIALRQERLMGSPVA